MINYTDTLKIHMGLIKPNRLIFQERPDAGYGDSYDRDMGPDVRYDVDFNTASDAERPVENLDHEDLYNIIIREKLDILSPEVDRIFEIMRETENIESVEPEDANDMALLFIDLSLTLNREDFISALSIIDRERFGIHENDEGLERISYLSIQNDEEYVFIGSMRLLDHVIARRVSDPDIAIQLLDLSYTADSSSTRAGLIRNDLLPEENRLELIDDVMQNMDLTDPGDVVINQSVLLAVAEAHLTPYDILEEIALIGVEDPREERFNIEARNVAAERLNR